MRFIVSPAKKMVESDALGARGLPVHLERTMQLLETLRALDPSELQRLWACSDALAALNVERLSYMDPARAATPVVLAYEGIQYTNLAPAVMSQPELDYLNEHLRILSGFCGVVRPFDAVVPYRLEMQVKLAVGDARNLYEYWGDQLTRDLAAEADTVVNVASVEYVKAILPRLSHLTSPAKKPLQVITVLLGTEHDGKLRYSGRPRPRRCVAALCAGAPKTM